jgi:hypothetical protein
LLTASANGQEAAPAPAATDADEVVVRGRTLAALRIEIERAEDAVYERFNVLNADDELDIRCTAEPPLGTRIPVRECLPRFAVRAEGRASGELVNGLQGSAFGGDPQVHLTQLAQKSQELTEAMRRLAREDDELLRLLTQLVQLKRALELGREQRQDE